jgi:hypothetical protein
MFSALRLVAVGLLVAAPSLAHAEAAARPQRVMEVVSVKIEKLGENDKNTHRLTVVGKVPTAGWTKPALRTVRERHPNNAVAGFEMVAVPPKKRGAQQVTEITATFETTIGIAQHTLIVRGQKKSVECTMAGEISCE